jgi:hypothetical protein
MMGTCLATHIARLLLTLDDVHVMLLVHDMQEIALFADKVRQISWKRCATKPGHELLPPGCELRGKEARKVAL